MFKRTLGLSPRDHMNRIRRSRHGNLMAFDEHEQQRLLAAEMEKAPA
jgi:hypothetical protein